MGSVYFISDAHLGSRAVENTLDIERKLCHFLDEIKQNASAIYFLGDMLDFWFEYHNVVPKGFVRFLGKIAELTDSGVEVHYFIGNHDIWAFDYLEKECGAVMHREPMILELSANTRIFLAHGDGLGDSDMSFRFIRSVFHSKTAQWLFRNLFPADLGMELGLRWAKASRLKHEPQLNVSLSEHLSLDESSMALFQNDFKGEDKEPLVLFAKDYVRNHDDVDCFIFGHRHIEYDLMLSRSCRMMILGDWLTKSSYIVWDGSHLSMENYEQESTDGI